MGLRFRRSIKLLPGVRLNLSKSGAGDQRWPARAAGRIRCEGAEVRERRHSGNRAVFAALLQAIITRGDAGGRRAAAGHFSGRVACGHTGWPRGGNRDAGSPRLFGQVKAKCPGRLAGIAKCSFSALVRGALGGTSLLPRPLGEEARWPSGALP